LGKENCCPLKTKEERKRKAPTDKEEKGIGVGKLTKRARTGCSQGEGKKKLGAKVVHKKKRISFGGGERVRLKGI